MPEPDLDMQLVENVDENWNDDIEEDVHPSDLASLVVYSRDWTVETIANQIAQQNIDLNPDFQRRNAWNDGRRSKLIESLITGLPVPEIVLAEHPSRRRAFIVIDGKQRLLTIAGFVNPVLDYWNKPRLTQLTLREDLNGVTFSDLGTDARFADELRLLMNADVRCTVISNFKSEDVLYDIFYRLNTGSVPLSTQELRQVLHKGPFATFLAKATSEPQPLHFVLGLPGADTRLRDVELLLRFIALVLFGDQYRGNLKAFLDEAMRRVNADWPLYEPQVRGIHDDLNHATQRLLSGLGKRVGRKYSGNQWESRLNKVLFEVQAYYFRFLTDTEVRAPDRMEAFVENFKELCNTSEDFRASIESTTKTNERYETRFSLFQQLVNQTFGRTIDSVPVRAR